ncbi:MAG TPA: hypothetical protein VMT55_03865 [Candidatus Sulfotelmatobacter sp.]|nr:hypothetical protein [Candidatus Sulfotelmatobacter sp.]
MKPTPIGSVSPGWQGPRAGEPFQVSVAGLRTLLNNGNFQKALEHIGIMLGRIPDPLPTERAELYGLQALCLRGLGRDGTEIVALIDKLPMADAGQPNYPPQMILKVGFCVELALVGEGRAALKTVVDLKYLPPSQTFSYEARLAQIQATDHLAARDYSSAYDELVLAAQAARSAMAAAKTEGKGPLADRLKSKMLPAIDGGFDQVKREVRSIVQEAKQRADRVKTRLAEAEKESAEWTAAITAGTAESGRIEREIDSIGRALPALVQAREESGAVVRRYETLPMGKLPEPERPEPVRQPAEVGRVRELYNAAFGGGPR